ncbi:Beta-glucosidase BoGH3B-like protein, partial [Drosera capensis]
MCDFFRSIVCVGISGPFDKALSADWADMVDNFQKLALESQLGIPMIFAIDAVYGNNSVYGATIFPHNVNLGSARASGIHYTFAPCVAVSRDPRWGRCYESHSEDTEIVRKMTSIVSGLQGEPPEGHPYGYPCIAGRNNVIACAKHFVGDGGTDKGINEGNTKYHLMKIWRGSIWRPIRTVLLRVWNGRNLHADKFLLTDVLKDKLGFKGIVISDWEGLDKLSHPHSTNYRSCVSSAVNAGIDVVMVGISIRYGKFLEDLAFLVESGEVPISRIDDAVERILRVKFAAGLFERTPSLTAREAVRKSLVLLKNRKDPNKPFLQLNKNAKKILVAGTHADNLGYQCGRWTVTWYGGSGRITIGTTFLDAIKAAVGNQTQVIYEEVPSPDTLAEELYEKAHMQNSPLSIPFNGANIISSIADKIPTLVIIVSGRPLVLEPWFLEKMDALVAAWLPGSEGAGVTDVMFGDHEFKGALPVSWFKSVDKLPLKSEENSYDPLFPFGFGLKTRKNILAYKTRDSLRNYGHAFFKNKSQTSALSNSLICEIGLISISAFLHSYVHSHDAES